MTTLSYKTRDGDTVDLIAWRHYGATSNRVVEQLLASNAGLADYGPVLPAGIAIDLPEIDRPAVTEGVTLWQ